MSLRFILTIIGLLIIAAIVIDGYRHWRRAKKQRKVFDVQSQNNVEDVIFTKVVDTHDIDDMPKIRLDHNEPEFDDVLFQRKKTVVAEETLPEPVAVEPTIAEPILPTPEPAAPSRAPRTDKIITLHVLAEPDTHFSGDDLCAKFNAHGLWYGPMHIFHKYENNDGSGAILFSVANAFEPGTLNLDYPESFYTRGLTLFMQLSNTPNPSQAFEAMLDTATLLAKSFNARLCDQQRQPLTVTTAQDYRNQVSNYH